MKTIKIPKVEFDTWVEIKKTQTTKYQIVLKRQEIRGLEIPNNSTISVDVDDCEFNSTGNKILVPAYNVNRLLKFVFMEKLRNGGHG